MKSGKKLLRLLALLALSEGVSAKGEHCPPPQEVNTTIRNNEKSIRFEGHEFILQELGEDARALKFIDVNIGPTKIECRYRVRERENNRRVVHTRTLTAPSSR